MSRMSARTVALEQHMLFCMALSFLLHCAVALKGQVSNSSGFQVSMGFPQAPSTTDSYTPNPAEF